MSARKTGRVTREQLITMLDYFAANPALAEGKTKTVLTKKEILQKWEEMAALLHAADGPEKTVDQWQVVWRDMKSRTKIKLKDCRQRMESGESISANSTFTDLELRVIDILGTDDIENFQKSLNEGTSDKKPAVRKFEPVHEDTYSDPLSVQQAEEEYADYDEDYAVESTAPMYKKHKSSRYSASIVAAPNSHGERDTKKSFTEIAKIQANAMMMQAEAAKISAEAAKINAEAAKMYANAAKSNADALNKLAEAISLAAEAISNYKQ